ncbi:MAG: hypothetical protein AAGG08_17065 [Actinomycetota bacterium]
MPLELFRRRPPAGRRHPTSAFVVTAALLAGACAGDDEGETDATLVEITLLTTTTEAPVFEPDGEAASTTTAVPTTTPPPATTLVSETTVPSETTVASSEPATPASPFSIQTDGIGAAAFGAAPQGVIDFVSSVLGPATSDTGWIDPFDIGPCGGTELRQVAWGDLLLEFGDVSNITDGRQHFYGYYYGNGVDGVGAPPGLLTEGGLSVGSSVAELLEVHPEAELFSGDEFLGPNFLINDALRGTLTGLADTDVIASFIGGLPCSG